MKKRILITGGTGLLGTHLIRAHGKEYEVISTVHEYKTVLKSPKIMYKSVDITDEKEFSQLLNELKPDVVIHTAAHGRVDYCEEHPEEAFATNFESTKTIVNEINKWGGTILFCSTNMVFDGLNPLYSETKKTTGQTVYAQTKIKSEKYIQAHAKHFVIFRLMTMYGWNWQPQRKNMISMSIEKLSANEELWMTNDVFNNMLYVEEAAKAFWKVIKNIEKYDRETFHLAGADCLNRYQTVMDLCQVFDLNKKLVHEVSSDYFKGQEVPRSPNTCFDTTKAAEKIGFEPLLMKAGLKNMLKRQKTYGSR